MNYCSQYQLLLSSTPCCQMTTVADHLESAIDMSNLMLKYIPQEYLLYRNMALMQKALFFASALNKGSYAYNSFGHEIVLDDFFEVSWPGAT